MFASDWAHLDWPRQSDSFLSSNPGRTQAPSTAPYRGFGVSLGALVWPPTYMRPPRPS
jgi:hypothetical protein